MVNKATPFPSLYLPIIRKREYQGCLLMAATLFPNSVLGRLFHSRLLVFGAFRSSYRLVTKPNHFQNKEIPLSFRWFQMAIDIFIIVSRNVMKQLLFLKVIFLVSEYRLFCHNFFFGVLLWLS